MRQHYKLEKLVRIKGVNSAVLATKDGFLIDYASRVAVDAEGLASVAAISAQSQGTIVRFAHSHFLQKVMPGKEMALLIRKEHTSGDQLGRDWPFVFLFYLQDKTVALVCHSRVDLKQMFRQIIIVLDSLGLRGSGLAYA
ncbi:MAG: roadblock/LC7 domain-containing protein [Gammaproteobacteria bacterium]|nr:roadblock/LC7 domain-containing protein [Gammaproteobacteria bacterium]